MAQLRLRALQDLVFDKYVWGGVFSQYVCMDIPFEIRDATPLRERNRDVVAGKLGLRKIDAQNSVLPHLNALVQEVKEAKNDLNVNRVCGALWRTFNIIQTFNDGDKPDLTPLKNVKWFPCQRLGAASANGGWEFGKPILIFSDVASVLGANIGGGAAAALLTQKMSLAHPDLVAGAAAKAVAGVLGVVGFIYDVSVFVIRAQPSRQKP